MATPVRTEIDLDTVLGDGLIRSVYQPIVDLASGRTVAYEALARGPEGPLETPGALFAAARATGRVEDLDWACREAALLGAMEAALPRGTALFVNVEPTALRRIPTAALGELLAEAGRRLDVLVEVTERALVSAPRSLLRATDLVRDLGWGLALDDVGAETGSLAFMPFVRPDVVKLDLRLVQQRADADVAATVGAVDAHAERTGAAVLAEGIETSAHLETALALGATLGQGWYFGRPGPLVPDPLATPHTLRSQPLSSPRRRSPFAAVAGARPRRRSTKRLLVEMSKHLERQALDQGAATVLLGAFQSAERFTPATRRRYVGIAPNVAFVGALGAGLGPEPAAGVRGASFGPDDPLASEWAVVALGPHFAAALCALDLGDDGEDEERRFDFVLTYDRDLVVEAARSLMDRIAAT